MRVIRFLDKHSGKVGSFRLRGRIRKGNRGRDSRALNAVPSLRQCIQQVFDLRQRRVFFFDIGGGETFADVLIETGEVRGYLPPFGVVERTVQLTDNRDGPGNFPRAFRNVLLGKALARFPHGKNRVLIKNGDQFDGVAPNRILLSQAKLRFRSS